MVAAGGYHSLALTADHMLYGWGDGMYGQTGIGEESEVYTPRPCISYQQDKTRQVSIASFSKVMKRKEVALVPAEDKIKEIRAGGRHSMILAESGNLYAFGYGAHGQLGIGGAIQNYNVPTLVKSFMQFSVLGYTEQAEERIVSIKLGQNHSLALSSEGHVYSCGANDFGQIGINGSENLATF